MKLNNPNLIFGLKENETVFQLEALSIGPLPVKVDVRRILKGSEPEYETETEPEVVDLPAVLSRVNIILPRNCKGEASLNIGSVVLMVGQSQLAGVKCKIIVIYMLQL